MDGDAAVATCSSISIKIWVASRAPTKPAEGERERTQSCVMQPSAVWRPRTALAAYRALLRAQRDLFVNDGAALAAAHAETRSAFLAQANAKPGDVPALVEDAFEASQFIRQNVAQAKLNDRGNYGARPPFWLAAAAVLPLPSSRSPAGHFARACRAYATAAAHPRGHDAATSAVQGGFQPMTRLPIAWGMQMMQIRDM